MTFKLAPKEEILAAVEREDFDYFDECGEQPYFVGEPDPDQDCNLVYDSVEELENENDGDGHEMRYTICFTPYDLYVTMEGTYSSWGSSKWQDLFVSEPYTYEVRAFKEKK